MEKNQIKRGRRLRRKRGIRKRVYGTPVRPRLSIFRSQKHIYAQVIDDVTGRTLAAADTLKQDAGSTVDDARSVGQTVAEKAKSAGVNEVSFDRNGFRYHGRVKALADAAREAGLKF
jgi:large subunit ribosomal protein L18